MSIKPVVKNQKNTFNKAADHPLQTWEWGDFRKEAGNEVLRLGIFSQGKLTNSLQIMVHGLPKIPYKIGTLIKGPKPTKEILKALKQLAKKENLLFIKLEPNTIPENKAARSNLINLLRQNGCLPGKTLFTPTTFLIDLSKSEEELLKSFSSKTRYNIRLAGRKGVEVKEDNSQKAFEKYLQLTKETVERQGFYAHSEKYHRLMWRVLYREMTKNNKEPIARLLTAVYQGEIITTWIIFVWKDILYYPYGASTDKHKNLMANNLIMWEAIKYGKKLGLKTFDLWGREPGKGFTKFKEGYNSEVVEFLGTWDLIVNPLYYLYRIAETVRWLFLRLRTQLNLIQPKF